MHDFQSRDPGETLEYVGRTLAPHRMEVTAPSQMLARLSCLKIAPVDIVDIQYGTEVWINPGELDSHFLIHASLAGASTVWAAGAQGVIQPDNLYISSPGAPIRIHMTAACRHLTARISYSLFEEYLTRIMNIPVGRPLVFYPDREGGRELPLIWRNMLNHIIDQAEAGTLLLSNPRTQRQYSMLMVEILLSNYSNNYSDQIALYGNDISPWHIRRARDIIHSSLDDSISITELATKVGVSVRSLQNGFRQFLGLTPVEYVRRHRLEKLHRALMDASSYSSVTELMLDCGIVNFGRYAYYYRQQYGRRPSETLRSRRPG